MATKIYTDGSCLANGQDNAPGGWGVYVERNNFETYSFKGSERGTTNNRMELTAVIKGLQLVKGPVPVEIHTDSQYVKNGITTWIKGWKKNGWRTANRAPVKNKDLWEQLDKLVQDREISWHWVKGHAGHDGNEQADQLATAGARECLIT